jgi:hypothetical protein
VTRRRRSRALVRSGAAIFWELRGCWATGRRVSLRLDADVPRVEGHVTRVSATDAFVYVGALMVPGDRILSVYSPSRVGDSSHREGNPWAGVPRRIEQLPGQGELDLQ